MAKPDSNDSEALAEYRRELRAYLRPWRLIGLAIVIAAALWLAFRDRNSALAWVALVGGWAMLAAIIVLRTRYHLRRMREST